MRRAKRSQAPMAGAKAGGWNRDVRAFPVQSAITPDVPNLVIVSAAKQSRAAYSALACFAVLAMAKETGITDRRNNRHPIPIAILLRILIIILDSAIDSKYQRPVHHKRGQRERGGEGKRVRDSR